MSNKNFESLHFRAKSAIIIVLALIVTLILVVASYDNYLKIQNNVIEIEQFQLLSLAETVANSVEDFFTYQMHNLEVLSKSRTFTKDLRAYDPNYALENTFQNLKDYYTIQSDNIELIRLVDLDGLEMFSYPTTDYSDQIVEDIHEKSGQLVMDSGSIYKEGDQLYINVFRPIQEDGATKAVLYVKVKLQTIYQSLLVPVKAGEKGYASAKDSDGVLIMHPNQEDIGENVIVARKSTYPDFDWSELEALVQKQLNKESGVGIYHSLWFTDNDRERVKKFSAYAPATIGSDFWIINVSKDYNEVVSFLRERSFTIIIINSIIILAFVTMLLIFYRYRKDKQGLQKELALLGTVNDLNIELVKSKEKFERIFESGSDCIFVIENSPTGRILEVNNKVVRSLGKDKAHYYGQTYLQISHELKSEDFARILDEINAFGAATFEDRFLGADGGWIPVEINARIMENDSKQSIVMFSRDITVKRLFENEMLESKKREALMIYQSRLAAMGEMIGSIAHQWRQPLSGLSMIFTNLEDAYRHGELDGDYLLSQSQRHDTLVKYMSQTIDDFRFFFDPKLDKKQFLISSVIDKTLDFLKEPIRLSNIDIRYQMASDKLLYGRPNQLSQVLFSILKNAIDALLSGESDAKTIWINVQIDENETVIEIEDNAGGVQAEHLPRLFDAYFTTKDALNGTGLGLYISKVIIEKNFDGQISATNTNNGLMITIRIPN